MTRTRTIATVIVILVLFVGVPAFWWRDDLLVAFHRYRLATEIEEWRQQPVAGEIRAYRDYSAVESELSKLVALDAIDRLELQIRLFEDGATAPLPSLDRLQNGKNPAPIFFHIKGDPRIQPQTVVIWCEPSDTPHWKRFAESSLTDHSAKDGEPERWTRAADVPFLETDR